MGVARRFVPITLDNLDQLPMRCRSCVYWELDPVGASRIRVAGDARLAKEAWVSSTLLEWGSCGRLLQLDGEPAGYVLYAPPAYVPRAAAFPTSPASPDSVLLMAVHVTPAYAGHGLGRQLIQTVAKDLVQRNVRAIEAFGSHRGDGRPGGRRTRSIRESEASPSDGCVLPAGFLLSVGFKTVRPHPRCPRLRLDLRTAITWRDDVEAALERLLGAVQAPVHGALPTPARRAGDPAGS